MFAAPAAVVLSLRAVSPPGAVSTTVFDEPVETDPPAHTTVVPQVTSDQVLAPVPGSVSAADDAAMSPAAVSAPRESTRRTPD